VREVLEDRHRGHEVEVLGRELLQRLGEVQRPDLDALRRRVVAQRVERAVVVVVLLGERRAHARARQCDRERGHEAADLQDAQRAGLRSAPVAHEGLERRDVACLGVAQVLLGIERARIPPGVLPRDYGQEMGVSKGNASASAWR
jgi:hypothetical protein